MFQRNNLLYSIASKTISTSILPQVTQVSYISISILVQKLFSLTRPFSRVQFLITTISLITIRSYTVNTPIISSRPTIIQRLVLFNTGRGFELYIGCSYERGFSHVTATKTTLRMEPFVTIPILFSSRQQNTVPI